MRKNQFRNHEGSSYYSQWNHVRSKRYRGTFAGEALSNLVESLVENFVSFVSMFFSTESWPFRSCDSRQTEQRPTDSELCHERGGGCVPCRKRMGPALLKSTSVAMFVHHKSICVLFYFVPSCAFLFVLHWYCNETWIYLRINVFHLNDRLFQSTKLTVLHVIRMFIWG